MNTLTEIETLSDGKRIRVARAKPHARTDAISERDRRAMNNMAPETRSIHIRLDEWSVWVRRALTVLGWPTESYYHKWALLKIAPHPGFDAEMPERPANVDKAVATLCEIDKSVIWRYYCQFRPVQIWRGLHGIDSQSTFDRVLKRGRDRTAGALAVIER
jgi:hypothetical protein